VFIFSWYFSFILFSFILFDLTIILRKPFTLFIIMIYSLFLFSLFSLLSFPDSSLFDFFMSSYFLGSIVDDSDRNKTLNFIHPRSRLGNIITNELVCNFFLLSASIIAKGKSNPNIFYTCWFSFNKTSNIITYDQIQFIPNPLLCYILIASDSWLISNRPEYNSDNALNFLDSDELKVRKRGFIPCIIILSESDFVTLVGLHTYHLERFVFITSKELDYTYINKLLNNQLSGGHITTRFALSTLQFRLSIFLYLIGYHTNDVALSFANAPRHLDPASVKHSVIKFADKVNKRGPGSQSRSYSTSSSHKDFLMVSGIINALNELFLIINDPSSSFEDKQYKIETFYMDHLNRLIGSKTLHHSNKLFFLARKNLGERVLRRKFPETLDNFNWVGEHSYLISEHALTVAICIVLFYQGNSLLFLSKRISKAIISDYISHLIYDYKNSLPKGVEPDI
jgi:hypothetical protein